MRFGGLIKTFATRSASVIEPYRRDLKEFGSGLQKETAVFREVASRAVKDLPSSIEVGASVAHGSLGHAIDGVLTSTAEIIAHGQATLLAPSIPCPKAFSTNNSPSRPALQSTLASSSSAAAKIQPQSNPKSSSL
ncbi:hypothetical protein TEA_027117 [Camellia sinensis var. sinensis]|uniref:Senescence domain-containing protein n=1 Tax=Camellia sinensis var. sinensis TaxID=542762 RepID=A0A4S4DFM2_CAMSN|nr:hypothetical protein TEA_027117 [Camellia sinensis var. sinensis]